MKASEETAFETFTDTDELLLVQGTFNLIVWNDSHNTFEWVIETLVDICDHTHEQAEQCAYIIHFNGKYAVKNGDYNTLKPLKEAIVDRGINATIEEIVKC